MVDGEKAEEVAVSSTPTADKEGAVEEKVGGDNGSATKEVKPVTVVVSDPPDVMEEGGLTPLLNDLIILPPLNKDKGSGSNTVDGLCDAVPLPPIRAEEPVSSLRAALSEVCGFAHLTNYRLEMEVQGDVDDDTKKQLQQQKQQQAESKAPSSKDGGNNSPRHKTAKGEVQEASVYTGSNAVVSMPAMVVTSLKDEQNKPGDFPAVGNNVIDGRVVLDDYGDLSPLLEHGLGDGSSFRVVLERYDAASVRDHMTRLRSLLDGNAPTVTSFVEPDPNAPDATNPAADIYPLDGHVPQQQNQPDDQQQLSPSKDEKKGETTTEANKTTDPKKPPGNMPKYDLEQPVSIKGDTLKDFFYLACGEEARLYHQPDDDSKENENNDTNKANSPTNNGNATNKKKKGKKGSKPQDNQKNIGAPGDNHSNEGEDEDAAPEEVLRKMIPRLNELEEKTQVNCSIRYSGFHPPPSARKCMGDIAYLEVIPPPREGQDETSEDDIIYITAIATGFYVNKCSVQKNKKRGKGRFHFDPSPSSQPCFSHELLDCLLQKSEPFQKAWTDAIAASKERGVLMASSNKDGPFSSLFRVAVRGDFKGYEDPATASAAQGIDALLQCPTWLVPLPRCRTAGEDEHKNDASDFNDSWTNPTSHNFSLSRGEEEFSNTFGVDIRSGAVRDWNEELQSAREMPSSNLQERIERARVLHKVLTDFGEAALLGVKAISDGQISPMNPNEMMRSQVYLHNNIFFSRAVDAGVETFKIAKGDKAARKSASRDVQCIGTLHRMEKLGLHTLATVLIDYLGTRFVCQSILPGILSGEKTHTLLYGAVEAGSPLVWDKEMHEELEETLGKSLMVASRKVPRQPLTEERLEEIKKAKSISPFFLDRQAEEEKSKKDNTEKNQDDKKLDESPTIESCAPLEAKGIRGSDQRKYVLDLARLTPRDANWVEEAAGGTGKWEKVMTEAAGKAAQNFIPKSLDDDEWTLAVLRPEFVTRFTKNGMEAWFEKKVKNGKTSSEGATNDASTEKTTSDEKEGTSEKKDADTSEKKAADTSEKETEKVEDQPSTAVTTTGESDSSATDRLLVDGMDPITGGKNVILKGKPENKDEGLPSFATAKLSEEDIEHLKSLRMNVNVFLPDVRSLKDVDPEAAESIKIDEERVREACTYLWDHELPKLTKEIRSGTGHHIPPDGKSLTELLHQHGINCRYLGRLAMLAQDEERKDSDALAELKKGKMIKLERRVMPVFWLELLECEMVARAAKHVLDMYLTENGGSAASQPSQTIASFLSALVSEGEETAAQTETRMDKHEGGPDEDDFNALTMCDTGGGGDAVPAPIRNRSEVWNDIQTEIGRRFRYSLTLYNSSSSKQSSRALYIPLLRRVCQRTGVRLAAKNYVVGGKCLCSGGNTSGGRMTASFPISPTDIIDIVPLMKHSAAHGEGFTPCAIGPSAIGLPPLHISLVDARSALEAAHVQCSARQLSKALEMAQEAASLYQRVTDMPAHPGVVRCIDLMANILFEAGEPGLAAGSAVKALGLLVQIGGFDSADVISAHLVLFQMLLSSGRLDRGVKHLRAAIYLMEIMGGPRYVEHSNAYHKLGTVYHGVGSLLTALRFYQEAASRDSCDRLLEGMIAKSTAMVLAGLGQYKLGVETEKRAYHLFSLILGEDHTLTRTSDHTLKKLMKLAVEQGNRLVEDEKKRKEEAAADAIASQIEADETAAEGTKNKNNNGNKKKNTKKKKGKK